MRRAMVRLAGAAVAVLCYIIILVVALLRRSKK
jgi:hypothetical protein